MTNYVWRKEGNGESVTTRLHRPKPHATYRRRVIQTVTAGVVARVRRPRRQFPLEDHRLLLLLLLRLGCLVQRPPGPVFEEDLRGIRLVRWQSDTSSEHPTSVHLVSPRARRRSQPQQAARGCPAARGRTSGTRSARRWAQTRAQRSPQTSVLRYVQPWARTSAPQRDAS